MTEPHDEHTYELAVPFVICASHGGPHDDDAFVSGFRLGGLDARLRIGALIEGDGFVVTIRQEEHHQVDLLAMHHGYNLVVDMTTEPVDGWITVHVDRIRL